MNFLLLLRLLIYQQAIISIANNSLIEEDIHIKHRNDSSYFVKFQMGCDEINPEIFVANFCDENHLINEHCNVLQVRISQKNSIQCKENTTTDDDLPNKHLSRRLTAITAEKLIVKSQNSMNEILIAEENVINQIILNAQSTFSSITYLHSWSNICIIHSCSLPGENYVILQDILNQIQKSGLINTLDKIIVLNYGDHPVENMSNNFSSKILWFHVSNSTSFFEIPSIRILHKISQYFYQTIGVDVNILYLHTKGVSYSKDYIQIADWRNLMLHFLVKKHISCYHLLESGEFDVIGVNLILLKLFTGNFWWAKGSYLSQLSPLILNISSKYDAEFWLLSEGNVRMYIPHNSHIDHAYYPYPQSMYIDKNNNDVKSSKNSKNDSTDSNDNNYDDNDKNPNMVDEVDNNTQKILKLPRILGMELA